MKKIMSILVFAAAVNLLIVPAVIAGGKEDFQAIKKAVKDNPHYDSGKEVKWLKVLITDDGTNKTRVRVTLPIKLIELVLNCVDDRELRIDREHCDIDVKELFKELKELGPMVLVEIYEDGETVKVWLE
ncbi:MAG: hypothetical protein JXB26_15045 [Candidatus Aminicenantes bacterium]|nr:hypothetical protein [Candidatus Aminicenantes bacterium]